MKQKKSKIHSVIIDKANQKMAYYEKLAKTVPPTRKDPFAIIGIRTIRQVDSAIEYLTYPTKRYDREADYHIQDVIGSNAELIRHYHNKMTILFGMDHLLKKEYEDLLQESKSNGVADSTTQAPQAWMLDWDYVEFFDGYFIIHSPNPNQLQFTPLKVNSPRALASFNYIKKYIKEKVPAIFCSVYASKLHITSPILIDDAIMTIYKIARQNGLSLYIKESKEALEPESYKKALVKATEMTPEDFKKYKSKYIDFLVTKQSPNHKILPCIERLAHSYGELKEHAFLFSINCKNNNYLIVHENVNPDRATLLFLVSNDSYDRNIVSIYDFLQGSDINKRSGIREGSLRCYSGIITYKSIDHDDINSWQQAICWYINNVNQVPKKEENYLKIKYRSLSQLLREVQKIDYFKNVEHVFKQNNLPLTRKVKPADIMSRIPGSVYRRDDKGRRVLPIREGEWTLDKMIKLICGK